MSMKILGDHLIFPQFHLLVVRERHLNDQYFPENILVAMIGHDEGNIGIFKKLCPGIHDGQLALVHKLGVGFTNCRQEIEYDLTVLIGV